MALNKPKLISDLKGWMDTGSANGYPIALSGVPPLVAIIKEYALSGQDMFGNSVLSFTGAALTVQLTTLTMPGFARLGALKFATGFNLDWTGCTLGALLGPLNFFPFDFLNGISNIIVTPPSISDLEPVFYSVFTQNYTSSLSAATALAGAIETACTTPVSMLTYKQKIPPFFPISTITSTIS